MEKSIQQMFYDDSVDKQLIITYSGSGTTLTNAEFQSETMTVTESICDEQELRFGCCNASSFEIKVLDTAENFKGKKMRVSILQVRTKPISWESIRYIRTSRRRTDFIRIS